MRKLLKIVIAAGLLSVSASMANAAPASVGQLTGVANGVADDLTQVHFRHRSCERDRRSWHRHNRFGERRSCRQWRGRGRRPGGCVRFGQVWICP